MERNLPLFNPAHTAVKGTGLTLWDAPQKKKTFLVFYIPEEKLRQFLEAPLVPKTGEKVSAVFMRLLWCRPAPLDSGGS